MTNESNWYRTSRKMYMCILSQYSWSKTIYIPIFSLYESPQEWNIFLGQILFIQTDWHTKAIHSPESKLGWNEKRIFDRRNRNSRIQTVLIHFRNGWDLWHNHTRSIRLVRYTYHSFRDRRSSKTAVNAVKRHFSSKTVQRIVTRQRREVFTLIRVSPGSPLPFSWFVEQIDIGCSIGSLVEISAGLYSIRVVQRTRHGQETVLLWDWDLNGVSARRFDLSEW